MAQSIRTINSGFELCMLADSALVFVEGFIENWDPKCKVKEIIGCEMSCHLVQTMKRVDSNGNNNCSLEPCNTATLDKLPEIFK